MAPDAPGPAASPGGAGGRPRPGCVCVTSRGRDVERPFPAQPGGALSPGICASAWPAEGRGPVRLSARPSSADRLEGPAGARAQMQSDSSRPATWESAVPGTSPEGTSPHHGREEAEGPTEHSALSRRHPA